MRRVFGLVLAATLGASSQLVACSSTPTAAVSPLVGRWGSTNANPPSLIASQSTEWTFNADKTATRIDTTVYKDVPLSMNPDAQCTSVSQFAGLTWSTSGTNAISITGGTSSGTVTCPDAARNRTTPSAPSNLALTGTYSVTGTSLALTLNGSADTLMRK